MKTVDKSDLAAVVGCDVAVCWMLLMRKECEGAEGIFYSTRPQLFSAARQCSAGFCLCTILSIVWPEKNAVNDDAA